MGVDSELLFAEETKIEDIITYVVNDLADSENEDKTVNIRMSYTRKNKETINYDKNINISEKEKGIESVIEDLKEYRKELEFNVQSPNENEYRWYNFAICFMYKGEGRQLNCSSTSYSDFGMYFKDMDESLGDENPFVKKGLYQDTLPGKEMYHLTLGMWGSSVEILDKIAKNVKTGFLLENDCADMDWRIVEEKIKFEEVIDKSNTFDKVTDNIRNNSFELNL